MRLVVLCPHFDPDTAPTGRVMSRIVAELVWRGHQVHVVTSLPWYRAHAVEPDWDGRLVRREAVPWGTIARLHPFPGSDKRNLVRRALGFVGFSALAAVAGIRAAGWFRRVDGVVAMSPPLTLGLTGRLVAWSHRAPLVFNIQDVFPDAAVRTGAITDRRVIAVASWVERLSYRSADAVTVLSDDLADNVRAKVPPHVRGRVHVIPNFVDADQIRPGPRLTAYRAEHDIGSEPVVMYAGNVGFSQSLEMFVDAARAIPAATFVVNGDGAARPMLESCGRDVPNLRFVGYQPPERLPEVLSSADVHVVPLRAGLGAVSVPSKIYSILAAGRPVVAAIDPGTEVTRILDASGGGVAVPSDDSEAFVAAVADLVGDATRREAMGVAARSWVESAVSPAAVARAYEELVRSRHVIPRPDR
jgi:colanic acid biosynthesis glycosyl transferase WcaI